LVSDVSISGELSSNDLGTVDDLVKKIFKEYSKVKTEFEKLSNSSTPNPDSDWATFDTTVLEPAKIAFDKDKQEIIQLRNKKSSAPPAKDETPPSKENANDKYTKFYEKLTSKIGGGDNFNLPLEFSDYPKYVQTNFKEFNTDDDTVAGKINAAIDTLNHHPNLGGISIKTFNEMETGSLNLFFALLFFRCMKGTAEDKNMNGGKLERALTNLSLDNITDIIQELTRQKPNYSFVDIIDTLNKTLFDNNSQLVSVIDPSRHENPGVKEEAKLDPKFNDNDYVVGGSSSKSKKNRKSHKSYHPDIGKTKKHHHSHHKKISFVH
jgi:hypothetical protein